MSNLTILNTSIRKLNNLYNLKDLHLVAGNEKKHEPYLFTRLDQTKELIAEIQSQDPNSTPIKTLRGTQGGTYACKELVIAYAAWISPAFHLTVLRAFLNQVEPHPKQIALPEPEKKYPFEFTEYELEQLVWLWCSHKQMNNLLGEMIAPLEAIGSRFEPIVYSHHHEYKRHYTETTDTIKRLITPFEHSHRMNWTRAINLINR